MKHYKVLFRFTLNVSRLSAGAPFSPPLSQDLSSETQNRSNSHCPATSRLQILSGKTGMAANSHGYDKAISCRCSKNDWNNSIIHGNRTNGGQNISHISPNFSQRVCFLVPDLHMSCNLMCYDSTHEVIAAWLAFYALALGGSRMKTTRCRRRKDRVLETRGQRNPSPPTGNGLILVDVLSNEGGRPPTIHRLIQRLTYNMFRGN